MPCVFTIDVEDWFHILDLPGAPKVDEWPRIPSRVEANFNRLLDLLDEYQVQATCFFLGWVAQQYPHLVKDAAARGHEIASHGYGHRLVYELSQDEFESDTVRTKSLLEDTTGGPVAGYRASGFSVTERTPWFFDVLLRAGHQYDASVFPAVRAHGGLRRANQHPHRIERDGQALWEFPATVVSVLGRRLCLFGGGYLRLAPFTLIRRYTRRVMANDRPVIFYIHPRDLDSGQPRLPMSLYRRFKSYVNLAGTETKIRGLLNEFSFVKLGDLAAQLAAEAEQPL